jgi:DNA-directed RNA polymerase specialized sigma24 family protein
MPDPGSVTVWIAELKAGQAVAAERLWENYFQRLVDLARRHLRGLPSAAADEEDVVLSAFDSFCRGAEQGRFSRLDDRDDLWQVLVLLTARKASRLRKHERRQKRGGGMVRHASTHEEEGPGLADLVGREPSPEFAFQMSEEFRRLLGCLPDEGLKAVAVAKMEGFSNAEIAKQLGVVERTVERRLGVIRKLWSVEEDRS